MNGNEVLFPLPVDLTDCWPVAAEIGDLIDAALREVGGTVHGRHRRAGDAEIAKAQRLALDRFGVPYRLVTLAEYREAVLSAIGRNRPHHYGISVRSDWLPSTAEAAS